LNAFLLKGAADSFAKAHGGRVVDYAGARAAAVASR
jgi:NitT/TauT family transport system substrate-binding protein